MNCRGFLSCVLLSVLWSAVACADDGKSDNCSSYRTSDQRLALETAMRNIPLTKYDEAWHRDVGRIANKYWAARLSGNSSVLESLYRGLSTDELKRQIALDVDIWEKETLLRQEIVGVEFHATDGRCKAVVYSEVLVRENRGSCVVDLVAVEFVFDHGWFLVPSDGHPQIFQ